MKKVILVLTLALIVACGSDKKSNGKLKVVTTTTMLTDLLKQIGGDKIDLHGLMGAGVDPHMYKATEGDTNKLFQSDVVVYSGLHLESKFEEIFKKMKGQNKNIIVAAEGLIKDDLYESPDFEGNFDPHMWHDTRNWAKVAKHVTNKLVEFDAKNAAFYKENYAKYHAKLEVLEKFIETKLSELPVEKRIMVTAHDAFSYFGRQHNFKIRGLQGISTNAEAGVQDVQNLTTFIIEKKLKAIFVESSVAPKHIEAVQKAVESKGHKVTIGGSLFSDALGSVGTPEETYIGTYKANVNTIVNALK